MTSRAVVPVVIVAAFLGAATAYAQRFGGGRQRFVPPAALATADSFDGAWNFCRLAYRGRLLVHRLSRCRLQLQHAALGADQDDGQPDARGRGPAAHRPAHRRRAVPVPVRDAVAGRVAVFQRGGRRAAARLPAQGRLRLGRRFLGDLRLAELRARDAQGPARSEVPLRRPAAEPLDVPHVLRPAEGAADPGHQLLARQRRRHLRTGRRQRRSRTCAASPTSTAG